MPVLKVLSVVNALRMLFSRRKPSDQNARRPVVVALVRNTRLADIYAFPFRSRNHTANSSCFRGAHRPSAVAFLEDVQRHGHADVSTTFQ